MTFEWYERQRRGLGFEFLDCVEMALDNIVDFPEMYPIAYSRFRGCVIRRFPFSIFYTVEGEEIIVHSVFDNRQDPKKRR
uniref:ParE toxin of type II toxin-antitoxin system, parDE n=1 Tax=Candidatus Kentrum sp. DK TaxID=2126562 RepID=A0A450T4M4_9GAMM|nr:MAG: ParE toxin of type II toxin-antitoxin system, parDE [Candidatus Kentron sp. DK]